MRAADFAQLLKGARRSGEGWSAVCPAHEDQRASLSFRDGKRGLLVKCHAGCTVEVIAVALGMSTAALLYDDGGGRSRIIAVYPYRNEGGTLVYEVLRYEPKAFRQRRPDGHERIWNLDGVRRVLYRLPELIADLKAKPPSERIVYLAEGEKDVERLRGLGLMATTNPGGAGKWREEFTAQLKDAGADEVVLLPDNDGPGEAHALAVGRSCLTAGLTVKIVRFPGLPPKGDVSDWFAAGHTKEELAEIVKASPVVTEAASGSSPETEAPPSASGSVLVRLSEVEPEQVDWLWPGRIARGKPTLLIGDPGLGKSFVTLDLAARVTRQSAWPDGGRAPQGHVILLTAEDGLADTVRPRVDAQGGDPGKITVLQAVTQDGAERGFSLAVDMPALEEAVVRTQAALVIIDPLSAYLGRRTDSWKDADVRGVLAPLAALAERHKVAVVAVLHLSKDGQRQALYRAQGSIAFVAAARGVFAVAKDPQAPERRLFVPIKTNLAALPPTLAFRITAKCLEWEPDPVDAEAEAVLAGSGSPEEQEERRDADEFLREFLKGGQMLAGEVFRAARSNGIAERTLKRSKKRLGVRVRHEGQPGQSGRWYWSLPKGAMGLPKGATIPEVASFGELIGGKAELVGTSSKGATSQGLAPFGDGSGPLRAEGDLDEGVIE